MVRLRARAGAAGSRYAHLFSGPIADAPEEPGGRSGGEPAALVALISAAAQRNSARRRASTGSNEVSQLRAELDELKKRLGA